MRDSEPLFIIVSSLRSLIIEDSIFINATNGVVGLGVINGALSSHQTIIIKNSLFQDNSAGTNAYGGTILSFLGSAQKGFQSSLDVLFSNNTFLNNQAPCKICILSTTLIMA